MSRAAYMREYRAKKRVAAGVAKLPDHDGRPAAEWVRLSEVQPAMFEAERLLNAEIDRLTAEVARLRHEIAAHLSHVSRGNDFPMDHVGLRDAIEPLREESRIGDAQKTYTRAPIRGPMQEFRPVPKPGKGIGSV